MKWYPLGYALRDPGHLPLGLHAGLARLHDGRAVVELVDFPELNARNCVVVLHGMLSVIRKAGAKDARGEIEKDIPRGDALSRYVLSWS